MKQKQQSIVVGFLCCFCIFAKAQRNELFVDRIKTVIVTVDGVWNTPPVITLGSNEQLHISFDDLTHEYTRYVYKVEHCTWDWKPTEGLFAADYLAGLNDGERIENCTQSINTTVLYTHYAFVFPNQHTRIKLSGNYRIAVYNDETGQIVARIPFSVVETAATLSMTATTNTDIDWNKAHQQVAMKLNYNRLQVGNPQDVKTVVLQNRRWDNVVVNPSPNYQTPAGLEWVHNKQLIFKAGNEYRKFELLDIQRGGMNIDNMRWFSPYYHATLYVDEPRKQYLYDEDQNGGFVIRAPRHHDPDTEADYALVHFALKAVELPPNSGGSYYLAGQFTNQAFSSEYQLVYEPQARQYQCVVLLKQGYYNYQYIHVPAHSSTSTENRTVEGDFFQTENEYMAYAYYHPVGARYDRLVAFTLMRCN